MILVTECLASSMSLFLWHTTPTQSGLVCAAVDYACYLAVLAEIAVANATEF